METVCRDLNSLFPLSFLKYQQAAFFGMTEGFACMDHRNINPPYWSVMSCQWYQMVLLSRLLIVGSVSCWPSFYPAGCRPGWHSSLLIPNPYCLLFWGAIVSRFWPESPIRGLFSLHLLLEMTLLYPVVPCFFFHLSSSRFGVGMWCEIYIKSSPCPCLMRCWKRIAAGALSHSLVL